MCRTSYLAITDINTFNWFDSVWHDRRSLTTFQQDLSLIIRTDTRPELLTGTLAAIAYRIRLISLNIAKNIYLSLKHRLRNTQEEASQHDYSHQHGNQEFTALMLSQHKIQDSKRRLLDTTCFFNRSRQNKFVEDLLRLGRRKISHKKKLDKWGKPEA